MIRENKILIGFSLIGIISILLVFAFVSRELTPADAQEESVYSYSLLICDEPIPVGEAWQESLDLMNDVYRELQSGRSYLTSVIEQVQSEIADLYKGSDSVCDFSVCQPLVIDRAPDLEIKISYLFGEKTLVGIHIPFCSPKECIGEPCPDLTDNLNTIIGLRDGIKSSYEIVHDIFTLAETPLTEDIRIKDQEDISQKITRPEMVRRKLQLVREWLHASTEIGKRSCSLTESERKKVAKGEMGDRYPMRCLDALKQGFYWPKMWSENCQEECGIKGKIEECASCLADPDKKGTSALSKINYKIYATCQTNCQEGLNENCIDCLCTNEKGEKLSDNECIAWICGGSYYNYVCCHETPLETY